MIIFFILAGGFAYFVDPNAGVQRIERWGDRWYDYNEYGWPYVLIVVTVIMVQLMMLNLFLATTVILSTIIFHLYLIIGMKMIGMKMIGDVLVRIWNVEKKEKKVLLFSY